MIAGQRESDFENDGKTVEAFHVTRKKHRYFACNICKYI